MAGAARPDRALGRAAELLAFFNSEAESRPWPAGDTAAARFCAELALEIGLCARQGRGLGAACGEGAELHRGCSRNR